MGIQTSFIRRIMRLFFAAHAAIAILALYACRLPLALADPVPAVPVDRTLRLASDDWCPFICAEDGKLTGGYLVELTAQAMAAGGYRVQPLLLPLNRAVRDTLSGAIEGVYAPSIDPRLRLSVPLAYSRACFYTRTDSSWTYGGIATLRGMVVGVIDDYGYDDDVMDRYIERNHGQAGALAFAYGEQAGATNLQKLLRGRYPVMLEHEAVAARLGARIGVAGQLRQAGCLDHPLPLTIGFAAHDARSAQWLRTLAQGLRKLEQNGGRTALRQRYNIPADSLAAPVRTAP